jgi:hypothetical protein
MSLATMWAGIQVNPPFAVHFSDSGWAIQDEAVAPTDARCIIELRANGQIWAVRLNAADNQLGTWWTGAGLDANDYDFQWQQLGNNPNWPGGSASPNIWVNGGGTIAWGVEELGTGAVIASGTMLIRPAGGGATIDSAGVSLNCDTVA